MPLGQHLSGPLAFLPSQMQNFVSSSVAAHSEVLGTSCLFRSDRLAQLQIAVADFIKSEDGSDAVHSLPNCEIIMEHQRKHELRSSAMAFIITNTLMLVIPFEALAKTCETDNSVFNMPLLSFVALIGATVGGLLARQGRGELKRLNEQLHQINAALRRQAKIESYAPVGNRALDNEVIVDQRKRELLFRLKNGKNYLRNRDPEKAFLEFEAALKLAQNVNDSIVEKKAARGLGASLQRQVKFQEAIKHHSMVLRISEREGDEDSGNTEAYGAIADCYTELRDLERAGM